MSGGRTRAVVVGRRRPGRRNGTLVESVVAELRRAGWKVDGHVVKRKRALRRRTRDGVEAGVAVVVAVGGDGAVGEVAGVLAGTDTALAIVPAGTGNLLAGNLDIPGDTKAATRTILQGRPRRIDFGRVTVGGRKRGFAVACGIGFDATVMDATATKDKLRWGKLAYLANAAGASGKLRNVPHRITLDGVTTRMDAAQVFVANFGRMLPVVEPRTPILGDDGVLDVIAIRASGPLPGLVAGWEALRQTELGESDGGRVFRARATTVTVEPETPRLVEADGSVIGETPVAVAIRPGALTVLVPQS